MKLRAKVTGGKDEKLIKQLKDYLKESGDGNYEITIHRTSPFISDRLRNYLFGVIRIIHDHYQDLGHEVTIRELLHEIEDTLATEYEVFVYADGTPISKWYSKQALQIKEMLQVRFAESGLIIPDPNQKL